MSNNKTSVDDQQNQLEDTEVLEEVPLKESSTYHPELTGDPSELDRRYLSEFSYAHWGIGVVLRKRFGQDVTQTERILRTHGYDLSYSCDGQILQFQVRQDGIGHSINGITYYKDSAIHAAQDALRELVGALPET